MVGTPGYLTRVRVAGTPTTFTNEQMKRVGGAGSKLYAMVSTTKNVWDRRTPIVITTVGSTVDLSDDLLLSDYLFGKVLFDSTHSTLLHADGKYLPMTDLAGAHSYSLTCKTDLPDDTEYVTGTTGIRSRASALKDVSVQVSRWDTLDNRIYEEIVGSTAYPLFVVEVIPGNAGLSARAFMHAGSDDRSGDVSGLEVASIQLELDGDSNQDFRFSDQVLGSSLST
jgi:hypothetical protein